MNALDSISTSMMDRYNNMSKPAKVVSCVGLGLAGTVAGGLLAMKCAEGLVSLNTNLKCVVSEIKMPVQIEGLEVVGSYMISEVMYRDGKLNGALKLIYCYFGLVGGFGMVATTVFLTGRNISQIFSGK